MRPTARALALLAAAALLGACDNSEPAARAPEPSASANPEPQGETGAAAPEDILPAPDRSAPSLATLASPEPPAMEVPEAEARPSVPHIYLALQPGGTGRPTSAVFAIDAARDGTPSDDPAIRLTPEAGRCNPQEMRRYAFPADAAPVVSEAEEAGGLSARDLPRYLAAAVTGRLIEAGLASEPEDTRALNVCTRKLWERLVVAENRDRLATQ